MVNNKPVSDKVKKLHSTTDRGVGEDIKRLKKDFRRVCGFPIRHKKLQQQLLDVESNLNSQNKKLSRE